MLDPSYHGGGGQGAMGRHAPRQLPPGAVPGPVIWTKAEDDLLLAVTHEFGVNWTMVSAAFWSLASVLELYIGAGAHQCC